MQQCGEALAEIHASWGSSGEPAGAAMARDITSNAPWHRSARDTHILQAAGAAADLAQQSYARLYFDFDPCNVLIGGGQPTLLDPPDIFTCGPVQWDIATFRVGLERALWKPRTTGSPEIAELQQCFVSAYEAGAGREFDDQGEMLTLLCEIGRLAQLLSWWSTITKTHAAKSVARAGYAWPMVWRAWRARRDVLERMLG